MNKLNVIPATASVTQALAAIDYKPYNECMCCNANLLTETDVTMRMIDIDGVPAVYALCQACMAEVFKGRQRRRKVERRVEQKLVGLILMEGDVCGGTA